MEKLTIEEIVQQQIDKASYEFLEDALAFCLEYHNAYKWDSKVTKQAFDYYNYFYRAHETGTFCGACRAKVNKGLGKMIERLTNNLSTLITSDLETLYEGNYRLLSFIELRRLMGL